MINKVKKQEITREKILSVATELFMTKGFKSTSTRDIAIEVGISQPALYHHFQNKLEIYENVINDLSNEVREALEAILISDLTLELKLIKIYEVFIIKHPTNLFDMINDIYGEMEKDKQEEMFSLWNTSYLQPMIKFIEAAKEAGLIKKSADSHRLARYLLTTISPLVNIENLTKAKADIEKEIEVIVKFILYGIFD